LLIKKSLVLRNIKKMKRSHIFLLISIIGICYTWFYNIQYFMSYEDASLVHFFELAQSNFAGKSFGADLSVVVLTFFVWFIPDARKLKIKAWWVIIPLTFLIAVAFSFPFYLYLRERTLEKKA
tara:strand:- start:576 stop:944 length:369 start_codon:yes stop_codon:yes gene_type:complete